MTVGPSQPIPIKRSKNILKTDAVANSTHLLLSARGSIMNVEKILAKQGNAISILASDLAQIKTMLEDRGLRGTSDSVETDLSFAPANTAEELEALTIEFNVSRTT